MRSSTTICLASRICVERYMKNVSTTLSTELSISRAVLPRAVRARCIASVTPVERFDSHGITSKSRPMGTSQQMDWIHAAAKITQLDEPLLLSMSASMSIIIFIT